MPEPRELPARWRSGLTLLLLLLAPPALGLLGLQRGHAPADPAMLPNSVSGLLEVSAENLAMLLGVGAILGWIGRLTFSELWLRASLGWRAWGWGAGYSVALRLILGGLAAVGMMIMAAVLHWKGQSMENLSRLRPEIENVIDPSALRDPLYFLLVLTLVSFVVAGFREELWRAAVLAILIRFYPSVATSRRAQAAAAALAGFAFGLGHLPQGWGGVVLTGALGFGLGMIMLVHRSVWIPVLAHGFFNATSFLLLRAVDYFGLLDQFLNKPHTP